MTCYRFNLLPTHTAKKGIFTFSLVGLVAYLNYLLEPGKKAPGDIDRSPVFYPPWSVEEMDAYRSKPLQNQITKNLGKPNFLLPQGVAADRKQQASKATDKKRKRLTFSELTDAVVENEVRSEADFWRVAKGRKVSGDETLWESLGAERNVNATLVKILRAWYCSNANFGTLKTSVDYELEAFVVPSIIKARGHFFRSFAHGLTLDILVGILSPEHWIGSHFVQ